jgi:hypothetical protein
VSVAITAENRKDAEQMLEAMDAVRDCLKDRMALKGHAFIAAKTFVWARCFSTKSENQIRAYSYLDSCFTTFSEGGDLLQDFPLWEECVIEAMPEVAVLKLMKDFGVTWEDASIQVALMDLSLPQT